MPGGERKRVMADDELPEASAIEVYWRELTPVQKAFIDLRTRIPTDAGAMRELNIRPSTLYVWKTRETEKAFQKVYDSLVKTAPEITFELLFQRMVFLATNCIDRVEDYLQKEVPTPFDAERARFALSVMKELRRPIARGNGGRPPAVPEDAHMPPALYDITDLTHAAIQLGATEEVDDEAEEEAEEAGVLGNG